MCTLLLVIVECVACAVIMAKNENSIKLHVQNEPRLDFILDLMNTNHSLHISVFSKSNENFLARSK